MESVRAGEQIDLKSIPILSKLQPPEGSAASPSAAVTSSSASASGGLSVPTARANSDASFELVQKEEVEQLSTPGRDELFSKLEKDLRRQADISEATRQHFQTSGDVPSMKRFQTIFSLHCSYSCEICACI